MPLYGTEIPRSFKYKVYLSANDGTWIDFTAEAESINSVNAVLEVGGIKLTRENGVVDGVFTTELSQIVLDNTDLWLDGSDFGTRITASFGSSIGGSTKKWKDRKVKIDIRSYREDGTWDDDEIAIFYIKSTKNIENRKVVALESISNKLSRRKAENVTNAGAWYENASYPFIIQKLMKSEIASQDNLDLPDTYILPKLIEKPTRSTIRQQNGEIGLTEDTRAMSVLGRPPEFTGTTNVGDFVSKGGFCTAMYCWTYNEGTVNINKTNPNILFGNGTDWINAGQSPGITGYLRPTIGDCIRVHDLVYGNEGYYEIETVDSDTQITLKEPLKGNLVITGTSPNFYYSIVRIYMAISYHETRENTVAELWKYVPGLDKYVQLPLTTSLNSGGIYRLNTSHAGVQDSTHPEDILVGIGFDDLLNFTGYADGPNDRRVSKAYSYSFRVKDGEVSNAVPQVETLLDKVLSYSGDTITNWPSSGFFHFRNGATDNTIYGGPTFWGMRFGSQPVEDMNQVIGGEMVAIPFPQEVTEINTYSQGGTPDSDGIIFNQLIRKYPNWTWGRSGMGMGENQTYLDFCIEPQYGRINNHAIVGSSTDLILNPLQVTGPGYYIDFVGRFAAATSPGSGAVCLKYSSGQKGAFCIHPGDKSSSSGVIRQGGVFYFVYDRHQFGVVDASMKSNARLIEPYYLRAQLEPTTVETLYMFSKGMRIIENGEPLEVSRVLHPTWMERITGKNEFIIAFNSWDDSPTSTTTYPFTDNSHTYIYRALWASDAASRLQDYSYFLGTSLIFLTTTNYTGQSTMTVNTAIELLVGDIIRIEDNDSIFYARITNINGLILTLAKADGTAGGEGSGDVLAGSGNNAINIVARMIFRGHDLVSTTHKNLTILETRSVDNTQDYSGLGIGASSNVITWVSALQRDKVGQSEAYVVGYVDSEGSAVDLSAPTYHIHQPEGLLASQNEVDSTNYNNPFILFFVGGILYSKNPANDLTVKGDGYRAEDSELYLACNPVIDAVTRDHSYKDTDIIYGVGAPGPPHYTQPDNSPIGGKYYMFKYDTHVALRIPLADFSKTDNVWEALGFLAQKSDHTLGFLGEDLYFVPRSYVNEQTSEPELILTLEPIDDSGVNVLDIVDMDFGEEDIINNCKITPFIPMFKEPEVTFTFKPRGQVSTTERLQKQYEPAVDIQISQRDTQAKTIKLVTINGGYLTKNPIRFRYLISQKTWETFVYIPTGESFTPDGVASAGYFYISNGAEQIQVGDQLEVRFMSSDEIEYVGTYIVTSLPVQSERYTGKIMVSLSLAWSPTLNGSTEIPSGTPIIVRPYNKWSDYAYNYVLNPDFEDWDDIESAANRNPVGWIANGSATWIHEDTTYSPYSGSRLVKVGGPTNNDFIMQNIPVKANTTYKISVMTATKNGGSSYIDIGALDGTFIIDPGFRGDSDNLIQTDSSKNVWEEIRGTIVTTDTSLNLSLHKFESAGEVTGLALFDSIILTESDIVRRDYFTLSIHNQYKQIGSTNIFLKLFDENRGTYEPSETPETKFYVGDMIEVKCEGLVLDENSSSVQQAVNQTSVNGYGKQEKSVSNPFITLFEAKELVQTVVEEYAYPKTTIQVRIPMRPGLQMVDRNKRKPISRVDVYSSKYFKWEPNYTFRGRLVGVQYGKKDMVLTLRNLYPS